MSDITAEALVHRLSARNATGISDEIGALVNDGALSHGMKLPTIRSVAAELGVSVGTVAEAWSTLRTSGYIETRRRGGSTIAAVPVAPPRFAGWSGVDFLLSSPDTTLQPRLDAAFVSALQQPGVNAWGREQMVDALREAVEPLWPFTPEAWSTAGGGTEGVWLATLAVHEPGRPLAVEEPAAPGYLATLHELGIDAIGIPVDDEGALPSAFEHAIERGASALVLQPGGPYSTRHVLSEPRAKALAEIARRSGTLVLEEDSLGPISSVPARSLGVWVPDQTIRVLSFCRAYGLDVRTSVLGGAARLIARAVKARSGGVASNSRILQHALSALLQDEHVTQTTDVARDHYARRTTLARDAFARAGLSVHAGAGSHVLWVEATDERAAALALATRGIVVDVSSTSFVTPQERGLLRLSTAQLPEDDALLAELATVVARAVSGSLRVTFD